MAGKLMSTDGPSARGRAWRGRRNRLPQIGYGLHAHAGPIYQERTRFPFSRTRRWGKTDIATPGKTHCDNRVPPIQELEGWSVLLIGESYHESARYCDDYLFSARDADREAARTVVVKLDRRVRNRISSGGPSVRPCRRNPENRGTNRDRDDRPPQAFHHSRAPLNDLKRPNWIVRFSAFSLSHAWPKRKRPSGVNALREGRLLIEGTKKLQWLTEILCWSGNHHHL